MIPYEQVTIHIPDHYVQCWCGLTVDPKQKHFPQADPRIGPSHYPSDQIPLGTYQAITAQIGADGKLLSVMIAGQEIKV